MPTPPTLVLLTGNHPALIAALGEAAPALAARALGPGSAPPAPGANLLCFVDWLLPDCSGIEQVRRLRTAPATREAHITLVLDPDCDGEDRRRALKAGADDYLTGPLTAEALVERLGRHGAGPAPTPARERLVHGGLTLDTAAHQARWRGAPIGLRPNEFRLLAHFIAHPDQVFSRGALIERLGKTGEPIDERTVDVWVGRLRRALAAHGAPDPLRTVRSLGYVLDSLAEEA